MMNVSTGSTGATVSIVAVEDTSASPEVSCGRSASMPRVSVSAGVRTSLSGPLGARAARRASAPRSAPGATVTASTCGTGSSNASPGDPVSAMAAIPSSPGSVPQMLARPTHREHRRRARSFLTRRRRAGRRRPGVSSRSSGTAGATRSPPSARPQGSRAVVWHREPAARHGFWPATPQTGHNAAKPAPHHPSQKSAKPGGGRRPEGPETAASIARAGLAPDQSAGWRRAN